MIDIILSTLANWVIAVIEATGYAGVFVLMALESFNIPIPSEVIMPFSGFLAAGGRFDFWLLVFWGALGNLAGSLLSYMLAGWIIRWRHRSRFLAFLISDSLLVRAQRWFNRYGAISAFFSRLLPVIRTFISLPAGLGKMNVLKFSFYTFLGSFIWSALLAYVGLYLGENWHSVSDYFHKFDYIILAIIIVGLAGWGWKHLWSIKKSKTKIQK